MAAALIVVGWTLTYLPVLDGTRAWDARISEELADSRTDEFESLAGSASRLGDAHSIIAFTLLITAVLALARKWLAIAFVPLGLMIEFACFGAVNYAVQRPRPDVPKVGSVPSTFSYPSGHVAATLVCWIGAALLLAMFGRFAPGPRRCCRRGVDGGARGVGTGVPRHAPRARHGRRHRDGRRRARHRRPSAVALVRRSARPVWVCLTHSWEALRT